MKFKRILLYTFGLTLLAVGSVVLAKHQALGVLLLALGSIISLAVYLLSEIAQKQQSSYIEELAKLCHGSGSGNVYTEAALRRTKKGASLSSQIHDLEKAIALDPEDTQALGALLPLKALGLSFVHWLKPHERNQLAKELVALNAMAKAARRLDDSEPIFIMVLGIVADLEGRYDKAQDLFRSLTPKNPYAHLQVSVSLAMQDRLPESVSEIEYSISRGAHGWLVDFYYGRALNSVGRYNESLPLLLRAYKIRGFRPELIESLSESLHFNCQLTRSGRYLLLFAIVVLLYSPRRSWHAALIGIARILIGLVLSALRKVLPMVRHISGSSSILLKFLHVDEPEVTLVQMMIEDGKQNDYCRSLAESALSRAPHSAQAWHCASLAFFYTGDSESAVNAADKAVDLEPTNSTYRLARRQIQHSITSQGE